MRLRIKSRHFSRHFSRRVDGGYVDQLHQIIGEFEASEKICFRFISDRQTGRQTGAQRAPGFRGEATRFAPKITRLLLFLILQKLRFLRERVLSRFQILQAFLNTVLDPIGTSVSSGRLYSICGSSSSVPISIVSILVIQLY